MVTTLNKYQYTSTSCVFILRIKASIHFTTNSLTVIKTNLSTQYITELQNNFWY